MSHHLVIMAAGTGGHIMPGLAVAQEMLRRGWSVSWLGTTHGMENRLVQPSGIALDAIDFSGMRGKGLAHSVAGGFKLLAALVRCWRVLGQRRANAVLGMGGYVCLPGGLMAALRRKPLVLVNADAALLMSNRALLPFADRITFGFEGEAARTLRGALVTGNPVRAEIEAIAPPEQRLAGRRGPLRVLVVGGSLGAQVLNATVPQALAHLAPEARPLVTHQTGTANLSSVQAAYTEAGVEAEIVPFIDDMPRCLAEADLVVCRAGAITVSELCAAGVPSVLVPLVVSTTAHQRDNAVFMASHGAAIHLPQGELTPQALVECFTGLPRTELLAMAQRARALARPHAAAAVADEIESLMNANQQKADA